ncbi:MAG: autotransporter-associated beta strand repeat-containing protein [Pirellulales bacterium]
MYFQSAGSSVIETSTTNMAYLGGWAAFNNTFAAVLGGQIVAAATVTKDDVATWATGDNLIAQNGYTGTVGTLSVSNISFNSANASTVNIGAADVLTLANGGILMTEGSGAAVIAGGRLSSGLRIGTTVARELVIHQYNTAQTLTISSAIDPAVALVKAGEGTLILGGSNNLSSRSLFIGDGTVRVQGGNAVGDLSMVTLSTSIGVNAVFDVSDVTETVGGIGGGTATGPGYGAVLLGSTGTLILDGYATNTFSFNLSGGADATIVKNNWGITSTAALSTSFTGHVVINGGGIRLDGNTSNVDVFSSAQSFVINGAGTYLISDQDQSSNVGLIANGATITLANTAGVISEAVAQGLIVVNTQDGARAETVGQVILQAGQNTIYSNTAGGTNAARIGTLTMAGLTRQNRATVLLAGQNLGAAAGPAGRIVVTGATTTTLGGIGGGGGAGTTTITIIPYAVGEAAATAATETGLYTALGNSLVTYDANGFRPLNFTTEYLSDATNYNALSGVTAHNVRFSTNPSAALTGGSKTINSLVLDSSTSALSIIGGSSDILTLASGTLLATTTTASNAMLLNGFTELRSGTSEFLFYVTNPTNTLTIGSALTGGATALTKAGYGILALTNAANSYGGGTLFNQGLIEISTLAALGSGNLTFSGGGLRWAASATFDPSASSRVLTFNAGGAVFDTNGNNVEIAGAVGNGGTGALTKLGEGTLTLTGANVINSSGGVIVAGGNTATSALVYGVAGALSASTDLGLGISGALGGYFNHAGFETTLRGLNVNVNSTIAGSANLTFTGRVEVHGGASRTLTIENTGLTTFNGDFFVLVDRGATARTLTIAGAGNVVINNEITDGAFGGTLSKTGTGSLILNGNNTHTATTVTAGSLGLGNDGAVGLGSLTAGTASIFASGGDRAIANLLRQNNNTTTTFTGDYSLNFTGGFALLAAANGLTTVNNIAGGKTLTFSNVTADSLTAARTWTVSGSGDTIIAGTITSTTAFDLAHHLSRHRIAYSARCEPGPRRYDEHRFGVRRRRYAARSERRYDQLRKPRGLQRLARLAKFDANDRHVDHG